MRISDWSSDVCSSDLIAAQHVGFLPVGRGIGLQPLGDLLAGLRQIALQQGDIDRQLVEDGVFQAGWPRRRQLQCVADIAQARSEERRGGKECVSTCRSRWSAYH